MRRGGGGRERCEIKSWIHFTSKSQAAQNWKIQATAPKKVDYKIKATMKPKFEASDWKDMVGRVGTHQPGASGERSQDLEAGTGRWGQSPRPGLRQEEPVKSLAWGWGGWSEGGKEWQLVASGVPCLGVGWRPGRRAEQEAGSLQRVSATKGFDPTASD